MKLKLKTGRTHQIRVHMKYLGCPILGDPIYGSKDPLFDSATLMLHSKDLGIRLPQSNEFSFFTSDTPVRFKKVMHKLHKLYKKNSR
jgi:23S rRNA pseudouridine1911/1915/1917 synthase